MPTLGQTEGMIAKGYIIAVVSFVAVLIVWSLSGSNSYNMVTNLIVGVSLLLAIIVIIEVLKRKVKLQDD